MKFQPEHAEGVNLIARHDSDGVWVNARRHGSSVLVPWQGEVVAWAARRTQDLDSSHFDSILALAPALVLLGSGARLTFIKPAVYRALIERGIGLETMDTPAACRTYNVLAAEGRAVVAALLLDV